MLDWNINVSNNLFDIFYLLINNKVNRKFSFYIIFSKYVLIQVLNYFDDDSHIDLVIFLKV